MRRRTENLDWWDDPIHKGKTSKEILESLSELLSLSSGDIDLILTRTLTLIEGKTLRGYGKLAILQACTFNYLCSPSSGKTPINAKKFVTICRRKNLHMSDVQLMRIVIKVRGIKAFSASVTPDKLIKTLRKKIMNKFHLSEEEMESVTNVIKRSRELHLTAGKHPYVVAASAVWLATKSNHVTTTQENISDFFNVTGVSIRNYVRAFRNAN